ncbi:hypothetical protein JXB02_00610 [Candidatus Woesearchaeota archaeon]|nr:hypothetical protein [Candidatus Woesearchaeota archaeon]
MQSITKVTEGYIRSHPSVRDCVKRGIINYSALAREIRKEEGLGPRVSEASILVAARRHREREREALLPLERRIRQVVRQSEMMIRNRMAFVVLDRDVHASGLARTEERIKREKGLFFSIEGTGTITVVLLERDLPAIRKQCRAGIVKEQAGLSLITLSSPELIEETPGVIAYLTDLFFQNDVNISQMMSCWRDTLFLIATEDIGKVTRFLSV